MSYYYTYQQVIAAYHNVWQTTPEDTMAVIDMSIKIADYLRLGAGPAQIDEITDYLYSEVAYGRILYNSVPSDGPIGFLRHKLVPHSQVSDTQRFIQPQVAVNDHTCPSCGNDRCSKTERSCWKCGGKL